MEQHLNINTAITLHKEVPAVSFLRNFHFSVDLRPDGNHRLNAHLVQLIDRAFGSGKYSRQTVITTLGQ